MAKPKKKTEPTPVLAPEPTPEPTQVLAPVSIGESIGMYTEVLGKDNQRIGWLRASNHGLIVCPHLGLNLWYNNGSAWTKETAVQFLVEHV